MEKNSRPPTKTGGCCVGAAETRLWAIPHKDCATDASSNFSSDETKSGVNTGCIHEHFCEIWESVSYLTYADCVVRFFERWREKRRKSFVDFRVFSRNISENMHARCVREDTKQALKGNLQADGVQSRQTLFVRYCLISFCRSKARFWEQQSRQWLSAAAGRC